MAQTTPLRLEHDSPETKRIKRQRARKRISRLLQLADILIQNVDETNEKTNRSKRHLNRTFQRLSQTLRTNDRERCQHLSRQMHNLKSPLMVVGGAARQLRAHDWSEQERNEWLDAIIRNVTSMETIIAELHNEIRVDAANLRENKNVDLMALAREVVRECGTAMRDHTMSFRGDTTSDWFVEGDRELLKRLISTLVVNVATSSESIREVCVSLLHRDANIILMIEDCSCTIAQHERRFAPFVPLEKTNDMLAQNDPNLTLIKRLADAHRAEVRMQGSVGQGTAFEVKFAI